MAWRDLADNETLTTGTTDTDPDGNGSGLDDGGFRWATLRRSATSAAGPCRRSTASSPTGLTYVRERLAGEDVLHTHATVTTARTPPTHCGPGSIRPRRGGRGEPRRRRGGGHRI
jgi:hypothetical protein